MPNAMTCVGIRDVRIVITNAVRCVDKMCIVRVVPDALLVTRRKSFSPRVSSDVCPDAVNNVRISFLDVFSLLPMLLCVGSPPRLL
ncbi:hypothetical protein IC582_023646 [Cucumis melo]